jgi:hypothetical protein
VTIAGFDIPNWFPAHGAFEGELTGPAKRQSLKRRVVVPFELNTPSWGQRKISRDALEMTQ